MSYGVFWVFLFFLRGGCHYTHINSSLIGDQTWALAVKGQVLTTGPLGNSLKLNVFCMYIILELL